MRNGRCYGGPLAGQFMNYDRDVFIVVGGSYRWNPSDCIWIFEGERQWEF